MDQGRSAVETLDRSLRWPALVLAVLMQVALLAVMRSDPNPSKPVGSTPLQVVWIQAVAPPPPPPPWPVAPVRAERSPRTPPPVVTSAATDTVAPTATLPARPDRLELSPAEPDRAAGYVHAERQRGDARQFGRRTATLPGSDAAIVDIGDVVHVARSPQQVVGLVGALLFGARRESCDDIRQRVMHTEHPTVRQLELDKLERCGRR